jgi:hypothetical protein
MNNAWRPIIGSLTAIAATICAAALLGINHYPTRAAAALLIGAALVALILSGDVLSNLISRFSQDYKGSVATVISIGGGATVAFSLVWILLAVTGFSSTCGHGCEEISDTISLPLIVIVGVAVLLIAIALVTFTFSVNGLSSARDALGLPDGSVRAIIALMLLVLFSIMAIFLYNGMGERRVLTLRHVSEQALNDMRSRVAVISSPKEDQAASPATYEVTYHEINSAADDIAKQLIVMLGTLVTAVAAFYFGSASVTSASAIILGQRLAGPLVSSVSPSPIIASGQAQTLTLVGSNLGGIKKLHLEAKGQPDIDAIGPVDAKEGVLSTQINIPKDKSGIWNVVVNDGQQAVTIGTLEIKPAAATPPPAARAEAAAAPQTNAGDLSAMAAEAPIAGAAPPVPAGPVPSTINKGFLGHGLFLEYRPITTLQRYANYNGANPTGASTAQLIERFIKALRDMHMASVWIQLFSASGTLDSGHGATTELVAALKQAGIACVGWGYCYSGNATNDAGLAKLLCEKYGITAFIADVEPGNTVHNQPDTWDSSAFKLLIASLKSTFGKDNLGISTFGNLHGHDDAAAIYKLAVDDVVLFAPQIYWYKKPPAAYAQSCIDSFRRAGIANPLVATAQAYWEIDRNGGVSQDTMEEQVGKFVSDFSGWNKVIGANWYHGGNANTDTSGSMSDAMISTIAAGRLDQKPYAAPAAVAGVPTA